MSSEPDDDLPLDGPGEVPFTREQLTDLIFHLATKWPEIDIDRDEDGEIVAVRPAQPPRPVGRPKSSATVFRRARRWLKKTDAAREFLEEDEARYRRGLGDLEDRAEDAGIPVDTYKKRLTRARKLCPDYRPRTRGRERA